VISRTLHLHLHRWVFYEINRALLANGLTLAITTLLGAFGLANGGPPEFVFALSQPGPVVAVWLFFDLLRLRATSTLR
jgi:hypothetical protein